ncbi:hypothetical protein [Piscinibacter gummiphilus]|uniref:Uncharacterized protein n=1 Tax=Piscinibacter gummiphilus TaxID=946333 RepID=A0A1W6L6Y4_9BURK|nr:hypothetical protein [Piscinibacter gummiphilus]ARN19957.1 hypothetical protein A4W93_08535 [Piscinibacter gummiphilus]ATU64630.1 hypothetical protein CPZ87_08615 [Piscinibacter gummiphilus]GLS94949.1 hypothetical protein GCM10007918_22410 [Piscinibacter gummiphilus]
MKQAPNDQDVLHLVDEAIDRFDGNLNDLGSAIGMLMLARRYGWRVVLLIHSPGTVRKYLKILGLPNLREVVPEVGELAQRSKAWRLIEGTSSFWKVVRGQISGVRTALVDPPSKG